MSVKRILQIGAGGFGRNHVKAWYQIGHGDRLVVADLLQENLDRCRAFGLGPDQIVADYRTVIDSVDVVDVVTPSDTHHAICVDALRRGKHVFVEKPMTMTCAEARDVAAVVEASGRVLQVGYYYRFHPISPYIRDAIGSGRLGQIRYLAGTFMGFKRARTDVGVTHTDAIHFLDLFNWLLGTIPVRVHAVIRDHFGRGMEDLSLVTLEYPNGTIARLESGYIQPGRWRDKVVPNAFTTKEIFVCGSQATVEADFETEQLTVHDVHHELRNGVWTAVVGEARRPATGTATPVDMVAAELEAFLSTVAGERRSAADCLNCGVALATLMEAIYASASQGSSMMVGQAT